MIQTIKKIFTTLSLSLLVMVPTMAVATVSVSAQNQINSGLSCGADLNVSGVNSAGTECPTDGTDVGSKVDGIIKLVINIFSLLVGVVAVIMIMVGGLKYVTSGGDSGNVTGAKNTILYAIIGLVVVALAQIVVKFVLSKTLSN